MEKSSFFNAVLDANGTPDRVYLAEDFAQFFSTFIGNGVFPNPSSQLQVVAIDGDMTIRIKAGYAWINGYMYQNTDDYILNIDPADGVLNRIDRVVLRLDFLERKIKAVVKKGDYASNSIAKELQRDNDAYELALADIKVNKGAIKITQADITDLRQNSDYCGIVHGTVDQVDVTTLFNQYSKALELKEQGFETEFQSWFDNIKGQLSGDVATNLAGQIEDLRTTKVNYTDLAPITTTGTSSAYVATIPANVTEVTIVPHINNLAGATLNSVPILDREGKPIEKDTLKANIPSKIVRVGSNFFIASGGGNLKIPYEQSKFNNFRILNVYNAGFYESASETEAVYDSVNSMFISIFKLNSDIRVLHFNSNYLYMYDKIYTLTPLGSMAGIGGCHILDGLVYIIDTKDMLNGGAYLTIYNPSNGSMVSCTKYANLQYRQFNFEAIANGIVYINTSGNKTLTAFNLRTKTYNTYTILKDSAYALDFRLMASDNSSYVYTLENKKLIKYNPSDFSNIFTTTIAYTGTLESTTVYNDVIHVLTSGADGARIYRFSPVNGSLIDEVVITEIKNWTALKLYVTENYYLILNANGTRSIKKGTNTILSKSVLKFKPLDDEKLYCSFNNNAGGSTYYSYHMASLNVE